MTHPTNDDRLTNPIMGGGWDTQHMAAVVVFGSMLILFAIRRGFRGLNAGGISIGIK